MTIRELLVAYHIDPADLLNTELGKRPNRDKASLMASALINHDDAPGTGQIGRAHV